jgi:hypothetical protein
MESKATKEIQRRAGKTSFPRPQTNMESVMKTYKYKAPKLPKLPKYKPPEVYTPSFRTLRTKDNAPDRRFRVYKGVCQS